MKHRVIQGDALEVMRTFPDDSVDLVLCSPPYEGQRDYGIGFDLTGRRWVKWAVERYMECLRVCRGLVCWVVEGETDDYKWSAVPALLMAELHNRRVPLRKPPIMYRVGIPGSGGKDWLRNDYEFLICATRLRRRLPWSDNTAMGHPPKWGPGGEMSHRLTDGTRRNQWGAGEKSANTRRPNGERQKPGRPSHVITVGPFGKKASSGGRRANGEKKPACFNGAGSLMRATRGAGPTGEQRPNRTVPFPVIANPGNVIKCVVGGNQMGSKLAHENEAPFPEFLAEFIIRSYCPPGGTALDIFSGSGTTAAVALKHGRNAVAIDIRNSQCDLTRRRIAEALGET